MQKFNYFIKTFVFIFVFFSVYKIVVQLFEGIETLTGDFFIKTFAISLITALILGILNQFLKIDFAKKEQK
ncbi:hypothetical protein [uncultured Flavobacterium sp.]|uniref:hypothetical protein n=1 Tax=uncultured Flavobacterium sp. TaxID=165435 RepID=UPI0025D436E7|nr:hypothetical protein [uncultured Flavobacterium sp.]